MMLDTIALTLYSHEFNIVAPDKFKPNANSIMDLANGQQRKETLMKAVCNPTKQQAEAGFYLPRLTLYGRRDSSGSYNITLRVECSFPKLIYGNNFNELTDQDFANVVDTLSMGLERQGVIAYGMNLADASVSSIHYSKNIVLKDYLRALKN